MDTGAHLGRVGTRSPPASQDDWPSLRVRPAYQLHPGPPSVFNADLYRLCFYYSNECSNLQKIITQVHVDAGPFLTRKINGKQAWRLGSCRI